MTSDGPKYNNKYQTSIFFWLFIYLFIFWAEQPKLAGCHTSIVQPKEPQTSHPKWSPLNLRILDQSLQVEWRVWQAWPVAPGQERVIITEEKT